MDTADRPVLRSRAWIVAAAVLATVLLVLATVGVDQVPFAIAASVTAFLLSCAVVAWAFVRSARQWRAHEDELTAWAAERAAAAERLRIARDLHDLASHGLGLITVRAAAARTADGPGAEAERAAALADIERAGREATTELRRMLAVLRDEGEPAPLRPAASLDDLPGILDRAREAGVDARLEVGDLGEVSAGVQLTVCAIVREALANTARHAGPVAARVAVRREGADVVVLVEDAGPAVGWRPHPGAGHGLAGLRERVAALGGALEAEPSAVGFRLLARLPDRERG